MRILKYCVKNWWDDKKENFITDILEKYYILEYNEVEPDVVICSIFGRPYMLNDYPCLKILYIGESLRRVNKYYFNLDNLISISFLPTSENNIQYIGQYPSKFYFDFDTIFNNRKFTDDLFNRLFCINLISSQVNFSYAQKKRIHLCDVIDTYKKQEYGGSWRNTLKTSEDFSTAPNYIKNYKFNNCAENTQEPYYITEKIVNSFLGNSIPIYWGGEATQIFNEGTYIDLNHKLDEEIVEIIKEYDTDKNKYEQMFNTPLLKDTNFFCNQRNNIEQFLISHIDKTL